MKRERQHLPDRHQTTQTKQNVRWKLFYTKKKIRFQLNMNKVPHRCALILLYWIGNYKSTLSQTIQYDHKRIMQYVHYKNGERGSNICYWATPSSSSCQWSYFHFEIIFSFLSVVGRLEFRGSVTYEKMIRVRLGQLTAR